MAPNRNRFHGSRAQDRVNFFNCVLSILSHNDRGIIILSSN